MQSRPAQREAPTGACIRAVRMRAICACWCRSQEASTRDRLYQKKPVTSMKRSRVRKRTHGAVLPGDLSVSLCVCLALPPSRLSISLSLSLSLSLSCLLPSFKLSLSVCMFACACAPESLEFRPPSQSRLVRHDPQGVVNVPRMVSKQGSSLSSGYILGFYVHVMNKQAGKYMIRQ